MAANEPQEIPPVDDILKMNDNDRIKQLQAQFGQAEGEIDRQINYSTQAITRQFEIKSADMKRKHDAADPEKRQAIIDQQLSLRSQAMAKIQAVRDKYTPAKDELGRSLEIEMQKFSQEVQTRDFRLQTIRQLVQAGHMDPTHAKKAEYELVGIDWQPPRSSRSEKQQLVTDIRNLDATLERFTPGVAGGWLNFIPGGKPFENQPAMYLDPMTNETRKLDPSKPDDKAILDQMGNLIKAREDLRTKYQNTLLMENPSFRAAVEKSGQFRKAKAAHMKGTGNIETAVRQETGKKTSKPIVQRNRNTNQTRISYDGGKTWQMQ